MPKFLSLLELLKINLMELPSDVYPEDYADNTDLAKRSLSSSEIRAHMGILADGYTNLSSIYADKFLTTATDDGITKWEKVLFAEAVDTSLPLETRRQNLIAKLRASGGISYAVLYGIVDAILTPKGLAFEIATMCQGGAWELEVDLLDVSTYLAGADPIIGAGGNNPLDCALDYAAAGITQEQLQSIQETAYTFYVRIFGEADSETLKFLNSQLTQFEPARSTHVILNNFTGPVQDGIHGGDFINSVYYTFIFGGYFDQATASYNPLHGGNW